MEKITIIRTEDTACTFTNPADAKLAAAILDAFGIEYTAEEVALYSPKPKSGRPRGSKNRNPKIGSADTGHHSDGEPVSVFSGSAPEPASPVRHSPLCASLDTTRNEACDCQKG